LEIASAARRKEASDVERSDEIATTLASLVNTFGTPQMGSAFTAALSPDHGTLMIGTDPSEWWDDRDHLLEALTAQSGELQGSDATVTHSEGWIEGDVAWGAVRLDIAFLDGPTASMRFTATLARRDSEWKIVQGHASIGAANEETVGKELTV
jgi:SnoaL-like protein